MDSPALARAGIGSRAYAFLIDWHIRLLAALAWFAVGVAVLGTEFAPKDHAAWEYGVALPAALIYFLYHPVLEIAMGGLTPGKRMAELRIVASDGRAPGPVALLVRNLLRLVDWLPAFYMLGLGLMFFRQDQRRLGDIVADTVVVYDEPR